MISGIAAKFDFGRRENFEKASITICVRSNRMCRHPRGPSTNVALACSRAIRDGKSRRIACGLANPNTYPVAPAASHSTQRLR